MCLMLMATCCEDDIVPHVLPFVTEHIKNTDWRYRDAAVMAFGMCCQLTLEERSIFLPARRYASAGLCDSDVSGRLSVSPDVCLSHAGIVPSRAKAGS